MVASIVLSLTFERRSFKGGIYGLFIEIFLYRSGYESADEEEVAMTIKNALGHSY